MITENQYGNDFFSKISIIYLLVTKLEAYINMFYNINGIHGKGSIKCGS